MFEASALGTPLWPAGHLPLKGGDYAVPAPHPISPLEGEMAGRPEGGNPELRHRALAT
jgi:assimilatory nitrate reductase catalytic subunit